MNPNFLEAAISAKKKTKRKQAKVRDYDSHVLFCKGGDCKKRGGRDIKKAMKGELRSAGLHRDVRLDSVECLGLCKHGPNAIVYPGGTWYLGLDEDDAREIARSHIRDGEPVERLAAEYRPKKKAN
jgi:(2Fe-2S) ferredoxin